MTLDIKLKTILSISSSIILGCYFGIKYQSFVEGLVSGSFCLGITLLYFWATSKFNKK